MKLTHRGRRLRVNSGVRELARETILSVKNLIYPLFIVEGENIKAEIPSLQGQYHLSVDMLDDEIKEITDLGIPAVILYGLPEYNDQLATSAYDENGIVPRAVKKIKDINPELTVITDVCLCQYTEHGHCGIIEDGQILNDLSVKLIAKAALSHAKAGADIVAPSDMMDGRVKAIRDLLDEEDFEYTSIMPFSVKYASGFSGQFRVVEDYSPNSGDRKSYQMDPANSNEAIKEAELDYQEGADILLISPALSYLDIIYKLKQKFNCPIAAYNVSGEYMMIKAAAKKGLLDEQTAVKEILLSMKRAGADLIVTYFAKDVARGFN